MARLIDVLAKNIREYRKTKGLSQAELAKKVGVSVKTINGYENAFGQLNLGTLSLIAQALGVDETDLVYRNTPPEPIKLEHDLEECYRRIGEKIKEDPFRDLAARVLTLNDAELRELIERSRVEQVSRNAKD